MNKLIYTHKISVCSTFIKNDYKQSYEENKTWPTPAQSSTMKLQHSDQCVDHTNAASYKAEVENLKLV